MSVERPTEAWSRSDIMRMLDLLPIMEAPDFQIAEWVPRENIAEDNPFKTERVYHPVVDQFWKLCYESSCWIPPYDPLPEDETPEGIQFYTLGTTFANDYFNSATLNQVRRYLILLTRGERFADGHIDGEFNDGKMLAAFRRLQELYDLTAD